MKQSIKKYKALHVPTGKHIGGSKYRRRLTDIGVSSNYPQDFNQVIGNWDQEGIYNREDFSIIEYVYTVTETNVRPLKSFREQYGYSHRRNH